jgi:hypothetical protein
LSVYTSRPYDLAGGIDRSGMISTQPEPAGIRLLRLYIWPPEYRKARSAVLEVFADHTISPESLMSLASLSEPLGRVPKSRICPFEYRKA